MGIAFEQKDIPLILKKTYYMIKTKNDLKYFIAEDLKVQDMRHPFLARLTGGENWHTFSCIKTLRYLEYYTNKNNKNIFDWIMLFFYTWKHRKNRQKYQLYIDPNVFGPGLNCEHPGFRRIGGYAKVGRNCTILPNVLFGKKYPNIDTKICTVGDNCYIGYGVTILWPLTIGNNVTIGAGSVVTKNIPDNAIVAGNPAKVIRIKENGGVNIQFAMVA